MISFRDDMLYRKPKTRHFRQDQNLYFSNPKKTDYTSVHYIAVMNVYIEV